MAIRCPCTRCWHHRLASAPEMWTDSIAAANAQRLFVCVVAVCPGLRGGLRASRDSSRGRLITSSWTWQTNVGDVSLGLSWDQRADSVELAGRRHSRAAGNTFVARYEHIGHWSVQQLASIPMPRAPTDALEQIQRQLPDDQVIASLSIAPEANYGIIQRP
jgi:hypothetical protein